MCALGVERFSRIEVSWEVFPEEFLKPNAGEGPRQKTLLPVAMKKKADIVASFRAAGVPEKDIEPMAEGLLQSLKGRDVAITETEVLSNFREAGVPEQHAENMTYILLQKNIFKSKK